MAFAVLALRYDMRIKNRVCLAIHGDGGGLSQTMSLVRLAICSLVRAMPGFRIVFFRIGDSCIHEGFVFFFVIGIAIEITHASELGHLVTDELLVR